MKTMRNELLNEVTKKIASVIGETSIKIGESATSTCGLLGIYETKFPIEMLLESKNNKDL